ncbi:penicillin acylase family protein [Methylobacter tundripaludum]|uniref:Peptidase S45 penicillin amidase n=1 Tax=Methylobacter tundripaludum (strain ATCC BAA-1195 / DSM 17260 / SV96) TaxID=697282 RepID=G3IY24_METTV|nr:penicillin acylase family protein [Methylobacter tundripaludum]EGW21121.1 peptidase S45 penicillin amidase [Methylobacter tundripaludum SV96]
MVKIRKIILYGGLTLASVAAIALGGGFWVMHRSMPQLDGTVQLDRLTAEVRVQTDAHGMPVINAANRVDAVRALGYVTARDRLFQMELMRRKSAGRLAEIFGDMALDSDIRARTYGFHREAKAILAKLPPAHQQYLQSYADGVNRYMAESGKLPFEFTVLGYQPGPWTPEDSLLVVLGMCENLTAGEERGERMLSVMEKTLPDAAMRFLTPDTDFYTEQLQKQAESLRPAQAIPVEALATALTHQSSDTPPLAQLVQQSDLMVGSNAWAVGGKKTWDGRAILANDMHLGISVPNTWYRIELNYGAVHAAGLTLPGTPLLIAGSNRHIAWGATNLSGDFLDLVRLEINPANPDQYRVGEQWQRFDEYPETIIVKGSAAKQIVVKQTRWGPVANQPLLDQPVAIHWTALDADAFNLNLFDLEQGETLEEAVTIVNGSGGPQLNVLLADDKGSIAWTVMGKIPKRFGNDGLVSRSWADGRVGWNGYVEPEDLPRVIDPPEGILASANDRRFGKNYPYVIGHQFGNGYRAYRITRQLTQMPRIGEWAMFDLQLDTESEFYVFYQQLALNSLTAAVIARQPDLAEARDYLLAWNGRADTGSLGFALLVEFRKQLIEAVFTPLLSASRDADKNFSYSWTYIDTPLQALLNEKPPRALPDAAHYRNWDDFILGQLKHGLQQVQAQHPGVPLMELNWGEQNKVKQSHPFSKALPILSDLLDMPREALPGCGFCVRAAGPGFGASERLVVSPGHFEDAILHMPGGQSGQPLSPYYRDQQGYWLKGLSMPLTAGKPEHMLLLQPHGK